jgi:alcohol dehydrogenase class IV
MALDDGFTALDERQMSGFKDFIQFTAPTRVIAGRDLISGTGFEFAKEGARRVLIVTDRVLREVLGVETGGSGEQVGEALGAHLRTLAADLGLPTRLSRVGVPEDGIPALVETAMGDGCTFVNPREVSPDDFTAILHRAL